VDDAGRSVDLDVVIRESRIVTAAVDDRVTGHAVAPPKIASGSSSSLA